MVDKKKDKEVAEVGVGPSRSVYYGFFQEFGTRRHAAKPFLRPAFDGKRQAAEDAIAKEMKLAIEAEADGA